MARPNDLLTHQLGVGLDYLAFHSLCFGDLIGGHFFGEGVSFFTTFFISIGLSNIELHMGSDVVLKEAVGVVLQNTKVVLTLGTDEIMKTNCWIFLSIFFEVVVVYRIGTKSSTKFQTYLFYTTGECLDFYR